MTILSKDGTSSSGPQTSAQGADSKSAMHYDVDDGVLGSPPSYADAQAAGPSTTQAERPVVPTNFINIDKPCGPIKDTWAIDTNIKIPEDLLPSLGIFGLLRTRPNLALHSASGAIRASIFLVSSSSDRAIIKADTGYGKVTVQVSRTGSKQPFELSGSTKYGDMVIGIPRDYTGPLKYKTGWGKITFSPGLRANVVEISGESGFVGDLGQFVDYKTWSKDEVEVNTNYGNIRICYFDEVPAAGSSFEGVVEHAVKTALGWIGIR